MGKLLNFILVALGASLVVYGVLIFSQSVDGYPHPDDAQLLIVPGLALLGLGLLGAYRLRKERPAITERKVVTTRNHKERRKQQRRKRTDQRDSIRWDPAGGDRRRGGGRRKEDQWDGVHSRF